MVKPLLQEFIKSNPEVKQIKWTQYTPYFNDGEACVFGVRGFGFYFDGDDLDDHWGDHEIYGEYDSKYNADTRAKCTKATYEACMNLESELHKLQDSLQDLFGDHVEVTVTADGVETSEYDHD
jgi:hypothetical protein